MNEKSCGKCIHCRVCKFYSEMDEHKRWWVFFKNYDVWHFAEICDNYNEEDDEIND